MFFARMCRSICSTGIEDGPHDALMSPTGKVRAPHSSTCSRLSEFTNMPNAGGNRHVCANGKAARSLPGSSPQNGVNRKDPLRSEQIAVGAYDTPHSNLDQQPYNPPASSTSGRRRKHRRPKHDTAELLVSNGDANEDLLKAAQSAHTGARPLSILRLADGTG